MAKGRVTLVRSTINRPAKHGRTVRALGLRRLNQSVTHELTPPIQGMIDQVVHLIRVEEVSK